MSIEVDQRGTLARDSSGKIVENVSIDNWRCRRLNITADAWVLLGDGKARSSCYIRNNGEDDIILAPTDTSNTNDPSLDTCGMTLSPEQAMEPAFVDELQIYARVESGGDPCQVEVVEAF